MHRSTAPLAAAALLSACASSAPPDCGAVPQPAIDQCTNPAWMQQQADQLGATCTDQLVSRCYDLLGSPQNAARLTRAACDDYWAPCLDPLQSDCTPGDAPRICHRVVLSLYPTHFRTDAYFTGNQVGMSCRQFFLPGKPLLATPGSPIDEQLQERIWSRVNPWYDGSFSQSLTVDPVASAATSLSTPVEPLAFLPAAGAAVAPVPARLSAAVAPLAAAPERAAAAAAGAPTVIPPGTHSLDIGPLTLACTSDRQVAPDLSWRSNSYFDDPFALERNDIATVASCDAYAIHKYYDWAVFRVRMQRDISFDDVPDALRVAAAYRSTGPGNVGWLMVNQRVVSRSWNPATFSIGSNPAFPLTAGVPRDASLVHELLAGGKSAIAALAPADHAHRLLFTGELAGWSLPCGGLAGCLSPLATEDWTWHGNGFTRYLEQGVTPFQEETMRLYRQQLLELYARRAQVELAAALAGKAVATPALDLLWAPPAGLLAPLRARALARGELSTTLTAVTDRERAFLRDQFARDWPDIQARYAVLGQAEVEARLQGLDELLQDAYTKVHDFGWQPALTSCLSTTPSVLCGWLPEMFVDRFQGIREERLLYLPATGSLDLPDAGPGADQHRCQAFLRGASFPALRTFAFSCPLNSAVGGASKFEVCGCSRAGPDAFASVEHWHCGDQPGENLDVPLADTSAYPLFYSPYDYRTDFRALELFITRTQRMNEVAFAVATAFIPPCSPTPTMTEAHVATQQFGNGVFGATLGETFDWSKDGLSDRSVLDASASVSASFVGATAELLSISAHGEKARDGAGAGTLTLRAAGVDLHWPLTQTSQSNDYAGWSGSYYFSIGPVPVSVSWGVGGGWSASSHVATAGPVDVATKATAGASLFVDGGIDVGLAGAGVGASIDLVDIGPDFTGSLGMRRSPLGSGLASDVVDVSSRLALDTTLLSGRFYGWAKVGACPFCKKFDVTLFDWSGFHQGATIWSRHFPLPEASLDKLQGWSTAGKPPSCN